MALLLVGCAKEYDDSGLKERVSALETRVTALESNVEALQSAIGEGVFVAKVQEYVDPDTGKTIGVTVTYTSGDVKYFEITPQEDYEGPVLGVIKSGSGQLVWAIDGIAIQIDGKEVPVYQTPVFTLDEDGFLWVEINGEKAKLGQVQNKGATLVDGIFTNIKVEQDKIVLTLSDETTVNIPFAEAFKIELMLDECVYTTGDPIPVHYALTAATTGTVVRVAGYSPLDFVVAVNAEDKIIEITPLHPTAAAQFLVVADSGIGLVSTATLQVEPEGMTIVDVPYSVDVDYMAEGENGSVSVHIVSNIVPEVKPVDEWIHLVDVKAQAYTITLSLDDNKTGEVRTGTVNILKKDTDIIIQTLTIGQLAAEIEEGPANLSKKESANSYLVYAAGEYKFKAVKGNSTESVGTVAKAEILWESDNTTTAPAANAIIASVKVDGEFIVFSTPEILVPGNALIAAKDEAGTILWSWHIWIPETEIVNGTWGDAVSVPMMDRNLGALIPAATDAVPDGKSIGLFYQWGRKDPFPGTASVSASDPIATNGTISLTSEKQNYTPEESVAIPTVYIVTGSDNNKTWMVGTEAVNLTLWGAEKTVYDPCPPGYVVATWDKEAITVDTANKLFKVGTTAFPVAGYLDQGEYVKVGQRAYVWSSIATSADHNIAPLILVDGSSASVTVQRMSRGGNVRCVVANEGAIVPPTPNPGGGEVVEEAKDLSAEGTANCYVVSEAGTYTFKTVQGNSEESVGTVATADILWETYNNAEEVTANSVIAAVSYAEGYITFSTPATLQPGNALIAAKDAEGKILWSWHIWIPETPIADVEESKFAITSAMSRNLGALVDATIDAPTPIESYGLLYEWGRKDPFVGLGSTTEDTPATVAGIAQTAVEGNATMEETIANPTTYYYKSSADWYAIEGSDTTPSNFWHEVGVGDKTIYDPCPVGYMLPARNKSCAFFNSDAAITADTGLVLAKDNYSFSVGSLVFPLAGYMKDDSGVQAKTGIRTVVWSGRYDSGGFKAYGMYGYVDDGEKFKTQGNYRSRGGSVRCVREIASN